MEEENDFFQIELRGISIWARIRTDVVRNIRNEKDLLEELEDRDSTSDNLEKIKLMAKNLFVKNPFLAKPRDIVFLGRGRRKKTRDTWEDVVFDPFIEDTTQDYLYLEEPFRSELKHFKPAKTTNIKYIELIKYLAGLLRNIKPVNLSEEEKAEVRELKNALADKFDVDIDIESKVGFQLGQEKYLEPLYRRLLNRISPEVLILVNHHDFAAISAAKKLGIEVVEFQHGVIDEQHMAYNFPDLELETFPDHLFLWGKYWKERCKLPIAEENLHVVGNAYIRDRLDTLDTSQREGKILVISQWTLSEKLQEYARELSEKLDNEVVYKLHPKEVENWKKRYPELEDSEVRVIKGEEKELYDLFEECSIQVGVYSTAVYEGLAAGLQTFILDLPGHQFVEGLKEEQAEFVESSDEIVEKIDGDGQEIETEKFFVKNPRQKFRQKLEEILKE